MKTLQQQLRDTEDNSMFAFDFWHHYEPHFAQPRRSSANIEVRESIGLTTARPGDLITSLEGEKWRIAIHVENGQEITLPWMHVSNLGRVISHVYPSATQKRLGRRWDPSYHRLCDGKLKRYSGTDEKTSGWKLLIKMPHMGKLEPVWLDEECTVQSAASKRQERDIPIHTLVANTWYPVYENVPDVHPGMLKALRWDTASKEDKLWMQELFEVDHKDQNPLNNRADNFRRTTGKENNRAALRARGGNHANHRGTTVTMDEEPSNNLMELFN